ncbi:MAG: hypothetical protein ACFFG0_02515 [Candidatus Thorarchaeota archaeon]
MSKYIATAIIIDPTEVATECTSRGWTAHNGAIFCNIPELGYIGQDLIYCRYGLALPYLRIQPNQRVLVEPTYEDRERWFFTGLVDAADTAVVSADQLIIQLASQIIYATTSNTLHLSKKTADEPIVLGNKLLTWIQDYITNVFNVHTHPDPSSGTTGVPNQTGSAPTDILSSKVFSE